MALRNMEDDRACLEQNEAVFLIGGDLAEGVEREVRGLLHRGE